MYEITFWTLYVIFTALNCWLLMWSSGRITEMSIFSKELNNRCGDIMYKLVDLYENELDCDEYLSKRKYGLMMWDAIMNIKWRKMFFSRQPLGMEHIKIWFNEEQVKFLTNGFSKDDIKPLNEHSFDITENDVYGSFYGGC